MGDGEAAGVDERLRLGSPRYDSDGRQPTSPLAVLLLFRLRCRNLKDDEDSDHGQIDPNRKTQVLVCIRALLDATGEVSIVERAKNAKRT
jgi:hypothetical protein